MPKVDARQDDGDHVTSDHHRREHQRTKVLDDVVDHNLSYGVITVGEWHVGNARRRRRRRRRKTVDTIREQQAIDRKTIRTHQG
jgi:hypothetical protein